MTTIHQQLTDAYLAHCDGNPDAVYARKAFDAGAKAALEIAALELPNNAHKYDVAAFVAHRLSEYLRKLAKEIA